MIREVWAFLADPMSAISSTLVQVMAWCCQATSHYLSQCWKGVAETWPHDKVVLVPAMAARWHAPFGLNTLIFLWGTYSGWTESKVVVVLFQHIRCRCITPFVVVSGETRRIRPQCIRTICGPGKADPLVWRKECSEEFTDEGWWSEGLWKSSNSPGG